MPEESLLPASQEPTDGAVEQAEGGAPETAPAPEAPSPAPAGPPEKYEFVFPEGVTIDETLLVEWEPRFKELGLTQEAAQKIVDAYPTLVQRIDARRQELEKEALELRRKENREKAAKDLEFGGTQFPENRKLVESSFRRWATPQFAEFVIDSGLVDEPELFRVFYRIARATQEAQPASGATKPPKERTLTDVLYGTVDGPLGEKVKP